MWFGSCATGRGSSHLNEFAAYHHSQEKANQSGTPAQWRVGGKERGGRKWNCGTKREKTCQSSSVVYHNTPLPRIFLRDTCFNKNCSHIKFWTISKAGELNWRFIKALEQMNEPLSSRLDRFNKRGPGLYHASITSEFNAHLFLWMMPAFATKAFANWLIKAVILTKSLLVNIVNLSVAVFPIHIYTKLYGNSRNVEKNTILLLHRFH